MRLNDILKHLDSIYDPRWAEPWDSVGLIVGDPEAEVSKVLLALDPVDEVVAEAIDFGADLIITHHPLFLSPVSSVATTTPKGRLVHTLIRHSIALFNAHTNADVADQGVNEALAAALGLQQVRVLSPSAGETFDKWIVFVPHSDRDAVAEAMYAAGAGQLGNYDHVSFTTEGTGTFRPLDGANPAVGSIDKLETVSEIRLEMLAPRAVYRQVYDAVMAAHPYEEPAIDVVELVVLEAGRGHGRTGRLGKAVTLRDFAYFVSEALPKHHGATRVSGDLDSMVETVAVIAGSGGSMLNGIEADVIVTSDLKHHQVLEHDSRQGIIDVPHWASESPWLGTLAQMLPDGLEIKVSSVVTDPWSLTISE